MQHRPLTQLLTRAESCYKAWSQYHAKTVSLLMSLCNIMAQRTAAINNTNDAKEFIDTPRLVYKQGLAFGNVLQSLNTIVGDLESILFDLQKLELEATNWITKESNTMIKRATETVPPPLSTETLIQVAAIQPHDVHRYIATVHFMLRKEFEYKQAWLDQLSEYTLRPEQLDDMVQQWDQQPHIRQTLLDEISERIKLYKQVYKVVTSTD
ncbi:hypothetical protein BDA99DRAFT_494228 [Phascolomyces articulosus]|uniref:Uncharacterized protein n=1 Tax=Phascolomyces articulosus TaxID=60185 RepID=A0AAD5PL56_9FUNG|nr:hypothetical protein BDA99DRAFT_494228 [Phascolomyces articulosus]